MSSEIGEDLGEDPLVRVSARAPDPDPPETDRYKSAHFQELGANGGALSPGEVGTLEADPAELVKQDIGDRRKPKPQLIGGENCRARPIGKQTQLLFFDPVLHVTAGTVKTLVQLLG